MHIMQSRRRFLTSLSLASAASRGMPPLFTAPL